MEKRREFTTGIKDILRRVRTYNHSIGDYSSHTRDGADNFIVQVSNGRLIIPVMIAKEQEMEDRFVSPGYIYEVSRSFVKTVEEKDAVNARGLWRRIFSFIGFRGLTS